MARFGNRDAMRADPAWLDGRAALAVGPDAIQRAGDQPRGGRLADAAHAGQDEGMGQPSALDRIRERAHHGILAIEFGEGGRAVFAREHAIAAGACALPASVIELPFGLRFPYGLPCASDHSGLAPGPIFRRSVGGWTSDPSKTRYGCFLPDLTGLARRPSAANLPTSVYRLFDRRGQGSSPSYPALPAASPCGRLGRLARKESRDVRRDLPSQQPDRLGLCRQSAGSHGQLRGERRRGRRAACGSAARVFSPIWRLQPLVARRAR